MLTCYLDDSFDLNSVVAVCCAGVVESDVVLCLDSAAVTAVVMRNCGTADCSAVGVTNESV